MPSPIKYFKATPDFIDLDHERGGIKFAEHITKDSEHSVFSHLVLDLSGNVRLDYWGCSRVLDACVEALRKAPQPNERTLTVLTSAIYELKKNYAWLFFYKSKLAESTEGTPDTYSDLAYRICQKESLRLHVHQVSLNFAFQNHESLEMPQFVLSSK